MGTIANLFGYVLNFLYDWVQNYGWAIILFSILLRLIMLPLTIRQQKSMKKTAKVQEEVNKLQAKYKNNPEMLNKEVMAVYKREKVSPFSGCLSSILQIVIFLSVFYLVSSPLTYMRKIDTETIEKYKQEVQSETQRASYAEIKIIEVKAEEDERVNLNMNFLGLNLSKVPMQNLKDYKVYIIPILYVIMTFVNIRMTTKLNKKDPKDKDKEEIENKKVKKKDSEDNDKKEDSLEEQMDSMQQMTNNMNYMMPIMSIFIAIIAPLGLSLYWLVSNSLQLAERLTINAVMTKKEKGEN